METRLGQERRLLRKKANLKRTTAVLRHGLPVGRQSTRGAHADKSLREDVLVELVSRNMCVRTARNQDSCTILPRRLGVQVPSKDTPSQKGKSRSAQRCRAPCPRNHFLSCCSHNLTHEPTCPTRAKPALPLHSRKRSRFDQVH